MNLPHGYAGQGPEHSSGRMERFLQQCDDDPAIIPEFEADYFDKNLKNYNWQICNISTASNYFHVLRRQMLRHFRKPLIVFSPKKLLKYKGANSDIEHFGEGKKFSRTIKERDTDLLVAPEKVRKLVFCSGQVYYDVRETRNANK